MRATGRLLCGLLTVALLAGCTSDATPSPRSASSSGASAVPVDPVTTAAQTYVMGYPLVVSARTFAVLGGAFGVNQLHNQQALSDASSRVVVAPNADTLYSVAVLDLRSGPVVLSVPDVSDRYWTYQFVDMWTDAFAYIGTRATGGRGGTFIITPPTWTGSVPPGATEIRSPTPRLFLLGRFLARGSDDVANVNAITARVSLAPLDPTQSPPPPPPVTGSPQDVAKAGIGFFDEFDDAVAIDAPTTAFQHQLLTDAATVGVGPGQHPSTTITDPSVRRALTEGAAVGDAEIQHAVDDPSGRDGGWTVTRDAGNTGDDILQRAVLAKTGWGANVAAEAVYARATTDVHGAPLDGTTRYRLHFAPNQLPPVDAFWSLTLYGPDGFFAPNELNRFAIGDRTPGLSRNADGSLDILIQRDTPASTTNWLPAPSERFTLMMRMYLPQPAVLDGTYHLPPVEPMT